MADTPTAVDTLQAQVSLLVDEVIALEDELANRTLDDYADLLPAASADFWRSQLIANRKETLAVLDQFRAAAKPPDPPAAPPRPLHNRAAARPIIAPPGQRAQETEAAAARIRNRAQEIATTQRIPFSQAFRRAEQETGEKK